MEKVSSFYNYLVVLCVAIGSLSYGYVISILANTLSKPAFYTYLGLAEEGPGVDRTNAFVAAFQCLLYVGAVVGGASYSVVADRWGRRVPIALGCALVIFGGALQAGCVNITMMCIARVITGIGMAFFLGGVPLFQTEVSAPDTRGFMVGTHTGLIGIGQVVAQFIGVGFFHLSDQVGWRVPLALQCVFPLAMLCLIAFLPESPRWLYMKNRPDQALKVLMKLHNDKGDVVAAFAHREFDIMKAQIDLEAEMHLTLLQALKKPSIRKRFILGFLTVSATQITGSGVIAFYGSIIYRTLGFSPIMIGVITGVWCLVQALGNLAGGYLNDRIGRRPLLLFGLIGSCVCLICEAVLQKEYAGTTNKAGNSAAIFFIFLYILVFTMGIEATVYIYSSEIFPSYIRAQGIAFSTQGVFVFTCIFTAVAPTSFSHIGWRFYLVFASLSAFWTVLVYFLWPETKGIALELVGAAFGDEVVSDDTKLEHMKTVDRETSIDKDVTIEQAEVAGK